MRHTPLALCVLLIFLVGPAFAQTSTPSDSWGLEPTLVHVTGHGSVSAVPDQAKVRFEVVRQGESADALKSEIDPIVALVIAAAEDLGIARADIQAADITSSPNYRPDRDTGELRLSGATVRRAIEVTVRDLDDYTALVDAAFAAGVNQVNRVSLSLGNPAKANEQALAAALRQALERAGVIANTLGLRVARIREVQSHGSSATPRPLTFAAKAESATAEVFHEGEITTEAQATVVVELGALPAE